MPGISAVSSELSCHTNLWDSSCTRLNTGGLTKFGRICATVTKHCTLERNSSIVINSCMRHTATAGPRNTLGLQANTCLSASSVILQTSAYTGEVRCEWQTEGRRARLVKRRCSGLFEVTSCRGLEREDLYPRPHYISMSLCLKEQPMIMFPLKLKLCTERIFF